MAALSLNKPQVYKSGLARTAVLHLIMVIALPFAISLPIMLVQRLRFSLWQDAAFVAFIAVAFLGMVIIVAGQLLHSSRTRIAISSDAVDVAVPQWIGPHPSVFKPYVERHILFSDIAAVDRRIEVFGTKLAPVPMVTASIVEKSGERTVLGYMNHHSEDPSLPIPTIAAEIAARSGAPLQDQELVRGSKTWDDAEALAAAEAEDMQAGHNKLMIGIVVLICILLVAGFLIDTGLFKAAMASMTG